MRRLALLVILELALAAVAAVAFLALTGRDGLLDRRPLAAEAALSPFALPRGFGIDPVVVAEGLVTRMQERADQDLVLQTMLGRAESEFVREQAIPRLANAGVLRRMLEEVEGLGTVIEMPGYRALAEVEIRNRGGAALEDVALVLPGAGRIEGIEGPAPDLAVGEGGMSAVTLPVLGPGEASRFRVWLAAPPEELAARPREWRVGAAGGVEGPVRLYASQTGWNGAALQVLPWARWLIGGLLALVALAALALAGLSLGAALRRPRRA